MKRTNIVHSALPLVPDCDQEITRSISKERSSAPVPYFSAEINSNDYAQNNQPVKLQPPLFIAIMVVLINKKHTMIINSNSSNNILNKSRGNNSSNNSNSWICIPLPSRDSRKCCSQIVVEVICSGKKPLNSSHFV